MSSVRSWFVRGQPPPRPIVIVAITISAASLVAGWIGDAFLATIVDTRPLLLIGLSPRNRNLILATNQVDAIPYYVVGFFRLVLSDPANYLLGFWYGDRAIAWTERRSRTYGPFIRDGQRWFRRAAYPLIFIAPNNLICALSGATGVGLGVFLALNVSGTLVRLALIRAIGDAFQSPIQWVVDLIAEYRIPVLIVSVLVVAWTVFGEFRGDNTEISALREISHEADESGSDESGSDDTGSDDTGSDDTGSDDSGSDDTGSDDTGSDDHGADG